jgi:hypothetical protein
LILAVKTSGATPLRNSHGGTVGLDLHRTQDGGHQIISILLFELLEGINLSTTSDYLLWGLVLLNPS